MKRVAWYFEEGGLCFLIFLQALITVSAFCFKYFLAMLWIPNALIVIKCPITFGAVIEAGAVTAPLRLSINNNHHNLVENV